MLFLFFLIDFFNCSIDNLTKENSNEYDQILAQHDLEIAESKNRLENETEPVKNTPEQVNFELDNQIEVLKKQLDSTNMYSIKSTDLWEKIYQYIISKIDEFLKNNRLVLSINMRYSLCSYIIPLLPTEYILIFPSFYKLLIPNKVLENELISKFIKLFDEFLEKVKERSDNEFLPKFNFVRTTSGKEDIEMIKRIPDLISNEPVVLFKWLMDFKLENHTIGISDLVK